jgi:outer membrane protein OmpA-like peptidoglycan-associated protein
MRRLVVALACTVFLAACPRQTLFVVLPNTEGVGTGAITIDDGESMTTLDQPYAAAESRAGRSEPVVESQGNVSVIFRRAIAAQPMLPRHFRLYFIFGSDGLDPASAIVYREVFDDIKKRPAYQIEVVGHTDALGNLGSNQALSLARAAAIRDRLVRDGIDGGAISIAGRGELDLLVPTADQVAEPLNRCVVVTVR